MLGFLNVNKPLGITSHDIISRLRKRFNIRQIGHAGTLDPLATGVVVVGVGQATRLLNYLPVEPKVYEGQALLGITTDTYDSEGKVVSERDVPADYKKKIQLSLSSFKGKILQTPPIYSALKKNGKALYTYARQGIEVEIPSREVNIYSLEITILQENIIEFKVSCSGGTYIRSLVHEIGETIGCGAHLTKLKRTAVGEFKLEKAIPLEDITENNLLPIEEVLSHYPKRILTEHEIGCVKQGQKIKRIEEGIIQLLIDDLGKVISLSKAEDDILQPFCVLSRS